MDQLSADDISVLLEALQAWEHKDAAGNMMADLFGSMLAKDDPVLKLKMDSDRERERAAREKAIAWRKERSIVLQAKLLTMRNAHGIAGIQSSLAR